MHQKVQVAVIHFSKEASEKPRLLLLQTNDNRNKIWQNVTGSAEQSEPPLQAALRELKEETGISVNNIIQLDLQFSFTDRWNRNVQEFCFLAIVDNDKIILSEEHCHFEWINIDEISEKHFSYPSNYQCFIEATNHLKGDL